MLRYLYVALGSAIGGVLRYAVSGLDFKFSNGVFPTSTLVVMTLPPKTSPILTISV